MSSPTDASNPAAADTTMSSEEGEIVEKIVAQGTKVAEIKKANPESEDIADEVAKLLSLKNEYEKVTGKPYAGGGRARKPKAAKATKAEKPKPAADKKGATKLALAYKKSENFQEWYSEVIKKAELIEHHDVSGCYVLRPNSFHVWECITGN
ncbi:hypothetical protein SARC_13615, partial [Sphaeroforma arctica JP610]